MAKYVTAIYIEMIFDKYCSNSNKYIDITSEIIWEFNNCDLSQIIEVLNKDKRFIRLGATKYGMVKWLINSINIYLHDNEFITYERILNLVGKVYGYVCIDDNNLREYFDSNVNLYKHSYVNQILSNINNRGQTKKSSSIVKKKLKESRAKQTTTKKVIKTNTSDEKVQPKSEKKNQRTVAISLESESDITKELFNQSDAEKLIAHFEQYYLENHKYVTISTSVVNTLSIDKRSIMTVLKNDLRFLKVTEARYGLLIWLLEEAKKVVSACEKLYFPQIKDIAKNVYKSYIVSESNLRKIFIKEIHSYNLDYINEAIRRYTSNIVKFHVLNNHQVNSLLDEESILPQSLGLKSAKVTEIKEKLISVDSLRSFGLKYGYVYADDVEKIDYNSVYQSLTEMIIDFTEMGIELIDR